MAKHIVKCKICGKKFDLNEEQGVRCGARRYAHYDCYPEGELVPMESLNDPDLQELKKYISKLFGNNARWPLINKQIKKYKEENKYSYSGMLKSLVYFYDIKGNSIEKSNYSLGIIPFCYQDAFNYYYSLYMAQQANQNKTFLTQIKEILIKPPERKRKKYNLFNLEGIDEE